MASSFTRIELYHIDEKETSGVVVEKLREFVVEKESAPV